jgi:glycosyltransferase involved in cell wall biosynthesis
MVIIGWTDEMLTTNLKMRNCNITLKMVKEALQKASRVVFVCEAQKRLYSPSAKSKVIYVGVPPPPLIHVKSHLIPDSTIFTFLSIGIICPRKNQMWAVQLFKSFAQDKKNVRLLIVGARYTRQYEIDYLENLKVDSIIGYLC